MEERLIGVVSTREAGETTCLLQHLQELGAENPSNFYVTLNNLSNPSPNLLELTETFHKRGGGEDVHPG